MSAIRPFLRAKSRPEGKSIPPGGTVFLPENFPCLVQQLPAANPDKVRGQVRPVAGDSLFQQLGVQAGVLRPDRYRRPKKILLLRKGDAPARKARIEAKMAEAREALNRPELQKLLALYNLKK